MAAFSRENSTGKKIGINYYWICFVMILDRRGTVQQVVRRTSSRQQVQPSVPVPAPGAPARPSKAKAGWACRKSAGQQKFCFKKCAPVCTFILHLSKTQIRIAVPFFFMYNVYNVYWEHFRPVGAPCTRDVFGGHLR